jgi:hypothetical protein
LQTSLTSRNAKSIDLFAMLLDPSDTNEGMKMLKKLGAICRHNGLRKQADPLPETRSAIRDVGPRKRWSRVVLRGQHLESLTPRTKIRSYLGGVSGARGLLAT